MKIILLCMNLYAAVAVADDDDDDNISVQLSLASRCPYNANNLLIRKICFMFFFHNFF